MTDAENHTIFEQEYRENLIHYVMSNSGKTREQAKAYLDSNCPLWRTASPPAATKVEVELDEAED
jgi:hypothetical protein